MKFIFAFPGQETLSEPAPCRGPSGNSEPGPRGGCRGVPRQQTGSPKPYFRAARCWTAVRREHGGRGQMNTTALARHVGLVTRSGRSGSESLLPLNGGGWSPLPAARVLVVRATRLALATAPATRPLSRLCPQSDTDHAAFQPPEKMQATPLVPARPLTHERPAVVPRPGRLCPGSSGAERGPPRPP